VLPQYVPSAPLTIPNTELSNQFSYEGVGLENYAASPYWQGNPNGSNNWNSWVNPQFYSSFIEPRSAVTTIQMDLVGYTGTIKAQAADNYQSVFYNISESETYLNQTRTIHWTIQGWYPIVRLAFDSSLFSVPFYQNQVPATAVAFVEDGVITSVLMQNNGSGYEAPPKVNIVGNGAGARARAVWSFPTSASFAPSSGTLSTICPSASRPPRARRASPFLFPPRATTSLRRSTTA
jgi:hypothetical protein